MKYIGIPINKWMNFKLSKLSFAAVWLNIPLITDGGNSGRGAIFIVFMTLSRHLQPSQVPLKGIKYGPLRQSPDV